MLIPFYVVDLLAKEYGWTVEYIQNLEIPEIAGLVKAIRNRKDMEDILCQVNVNRGMSGNVGSNRKKKQSKPEDEVKNLESLAKLLGKKVKKVEK